MSRCKSCGAPIRWIKSTFGSSMPLDPEPAPEGKGNVKINEDAGVAEIVKTGEGTHRSHFASCPNAAEHRKR